MNLSFDENTEKVEKKRKETFRKKVLEDRKEKDSKKNYTLKFQKNN